MSESYETSHEAMTELWSELDACRIGMLWMPDSGQHPQPMTHFADPEAQALWFITSADTDLVAAVSHGGQARYTMQSGKGNYHASLTGSLVVYDSDEKIDALWSIAMAARFEQGREDPKVTLLKFSPREAAIWASDANPVVVGARMVQAAFSTDCASPEIGHHRVLDLVVPA
ncbi:MULTISPECIES: pyridoxamine 5'-phosphate oxidase family protein [unclassified Dinoroseobacter]|uniref:pyridoxamine 5'-phosphate oxidase family protein n=1 Tax=unclassified Dinoroseobacter TaxID=2620028 RepID=UPI003C7A37C7